MNTMMRGGKHGGGGGGSPESVPSLAEVSQASSNDADDVSRALFYNEEGNEISLSTRELVDITPIECNSILDDAAECDISVTSSEATAVASWNLSAKDSMETDHNMTMSSPPQNINAINNHLGTTPPPAKSPYFEEVPPEENPPSCNKALQLTPKQIADIFLAFEGARQMWPARRDPKEITPTKIPPAASPEYLTPNSQPSPKRDVAPAKSKSPSSPKNIDWKPKAESLEKECAALKKIIKVDSATLFKLKQTIEDLRQASSQKELEIEDIHLELHMTRQRNEVIKKERDVLREREAELSATIKILQTEVEKLTTACELDQLHAEDIASSGKAEADSLRSENEMLTSQVAEMRVELAHARSGAEATELENNALKGEIKTLKQELQVATEKQDREHSLIVSEPHKEQPSLLPSPPQEQYTLVVDNSRYVSSPRASSNQNDASTIDLAEIVKNLSARLDAMERDRGIPVREVEIPKAGRAIDEDIPALIHKNPSEDYSNSSSMDRFLRRFVTDYSDSDDMIKITHDPDEIEVLPRNKATNQKSANKTKMPERKLILHQHQRCCCETTNPCDPWGPITRDMDE